MTTRGVDAVLAHLAKLPPQESLTLAEQRAQYERAERAFPIPADVTVERVTAPVAPAEWLAPPSARAARWSKMCRAAVAAATSCGSRR